MPRGVYERKPRRDKGKKRFYRRGKTITQKIDETPKFSTRSHGIPGTWATVCELRDNTLFRFDYDANSVYRKMETVCNAEGNIEDVIIRRETFFMDGLWHATGSTYLEHCNYLATVQVCRIKLDVDPAKMGERP